MFNRAALWARGRESLETVFKGQTAGHRAAVLALHPHEVKQVRMKVFNGSKLAVSWLPAWDYRPEVVRTEGSKLFVSFPMGSYAPPPLSWNTCFVDLLRPLLVPALPPGLTMHVHTTRLEGWVDLATGDVDFEFESSFVPSLLGMPSGAPPLPVAARMTTREQRGDVFHAVGEPLRNGRATLVAVSRVPKTGQAFQDALLTLPSEALSMLCVELELITTPPAQHTQQAQRPAQEAPGVGGGGGRAGSE